MWRERKKEEIVRKDDCYKDGERERVESFCYPSEPCSTTDIQERTGKVQIGRETGERIAESKF